MDKEAMFDEVNLLYKKVMKSRTIEPTHLKKYNGCIYVEKNGNFKAIIKHQLLKRKPIIKTFRNYADAFAFIKNLNRQYKLPVKNMITDHGFYMTVATTQGRKMIFDRKNLNIVQQHNIASDRLGHNGDFYPCTKIPNENGKFVRVLVHNLITCHIPGEITIDHVNRNTEDTREANLRCASRSVQAINQNMRNTNKTGVTGVYYSKRTNTFIARWCENGKPVNHNFPVRKYGYDNAKQMAIAYRREIEKRVPAYIEARLTGTRGINMDEYDVYPSSGDLQYDYDAL